MHSAVELECKHGRIRSMKLHRFFLTGCLALGLAGCDGSKDKAAAEKAAGEVKPAVDKAVKEAGEAAAATGEAAKKVLEAGKEKAEKEAERIKAEAEKLKEEAAKKLEPIIPVAPPSSPPKQP